MFKYKPSVLWGIHENLVAEGQRSWKERKIFSQQIFDLFEGYGVECDNSVKECAAQDSLSRILGLSFSGWCQFPHSISLLLHSKTFKVQVKAIIICEQDKSKVVSSPLEHHSVLLILTFEWPLPQEHVLHSQWPTP